jgi:putative acetyltransferase
MIRVRPYRKVDSRQTFAVFVDAVHNGTTAFYTAEERAAWAGTGVMPEDWHPRLADHITYVATTGGAIAGFMTMGRDGHIDLAYVAPAQARSGIGGALYAALLAEARTMGLVRMDTGASHLAKRFFLRHGWQIEARQSVIRHGVALTNFRMFAQL